MLIDDSAAEDVSAALRDPAIDWTAYRGATVLVTGATGTIGMALVGALAEADRNLGLGLTLVAHGRSQERLQRLRESCGARLMCGDIRELGGEASGLDHVDFILHTAAITASARMLADPETVTSTIVEGTRAVLELAVARRARGVVCLSSMEVYGQGLSGEITEQALGTLDPDDPRSSYPLAKREAEALVRAFAAKQGLHAVNVRLGLTFGFGVRDDPENQRVPMQFARAAVHGRDIELHTDGAGVTNVCDLGDAVRALLLLATAGAPGAAYNVANPQATMTIREMAQTVADQVAGGAIGVHVRVPEDLALRGYGRPCGHRLDISAIRGLGWEPRVGMADMYAGMIAGWRSADSNHG